MADYRIGHIKHVTNKRGYNYIRNCRKTTGILYGNAARVYSRTGMDGYAFDVRPGGKRAHAMVKTVSDRADRDNLENNTLIKALRGSIR